MERLLEVEPDELSRAFARVRLAWLWLIQNEVRRATGLLESVERWASTHGHERLLLDVYLQQGYAHFKGGDCHRGRSAYDRGLALLERLRPDLPLELYQMERQAALRGLGCVEHNADRNEACAAIHSEGLALARARGDAAEEAVALVNLADALWGCGLLGEALTRYREAQEAAAAACYTSQSAFALLGRGAVLWSAGQHPAAAAAIEAGLTLADDLGDTWARAYGLTYLSNVRASLGDLHAARRLSGEAVALARALDAGYPECLALLSLSGSRRCSHPETPAHRAEIEAAVAKASALGLEGLALQLAWVRLLHRAASPGVGDGSVSEEALRLADATRARPPMKGAPELIALQVLRALHARPRAADTDRAGASVEALVGTLSKAREATLAPRHRRTYRTTRTLLGGVGRMTTTDRVPAARRRPLREERARPGLGRGAPGDGPARPGRRRLGRAAPPGAAGVPPLPEGRGRPVLRGAVPAGAARLHRRAGSTAGAPAAARASPPTSTSSGSSRTARRPSSGSPASPGAPARWGMFGKSYGGFTALQVAALQPPHLAAIVPVYFTDDRYTDDCHYRGGCLRGYYDVGHYGAYMVGLNALPPYPEWSEEDWARVWEEHLTQNEPYFLEWLAHQTDGEYWRNGSLRGRYDRIRCPVLMIGGWRDGYPNPPLRTFAQLRVPKRVLIGPWNHSWPDQAIPGPRVDWVAELRRWCDHWLKGEANGVADEPPITFYVQAYDDPRADRLETSGSWRGARDFPLPGASEQVLHLRAAGALAADAPQPGGSTESAASDPEAAGEAFDAFDYRPTVGIAGRALERRRAVRAPDRPASRTSSTP